MELLSDPSAQSLPSAGGGEPAPVTLLRWGPRALLEGGACSLPECHAEVSGAKSPYLPGRLPQLSGVLESGVTFSGPASTQHSSKTASPSVAAAGLASSVVLSTPWRPASLFLPRCPRSSPCSPSSLSSSTGWSGVPGARSVCLSDAPSDSPLLTFLRDSV